MKISIIKKNFTKSRLTISVTIPFFILQNIFCFAQSAKNIRFNHFSDDRGIYQPIFSSIIQDKKGYMWFGTHTGLIKYDGYTTTTFNFDPTVTNSLPDDGVSKLCEDSDGNIWIGAVNFPQLTKYNPYTEKFTVYGKENNAGSNRLSGYVQSIVCDKQGRIWIGTDAGLCYYEKVLNKFIDPSAIIFPDTLCDKKINCLLVDHKGSLWIGTSKGIRIYDPIPKKIRSFELPDKKYTSLHNMVTCMIEDHSGNIWVGLLQESSGDGGICKYDPATGISTIYRHSDADPYSLSIGPINAMLEDRFHNIWVGMYNGGISIYQTAENNFKTYMADANNNDALNSDHILSLFEDRSGLVWVGTNGGGLNNCDISNEKFSVYQNYNKEYKSHYPLSVYKDHSGKIFITTFGEGIYEFYPATGSFKQYKFNLPGEKLSPYNFCYGMIEASDGNLWAVSFAEGLYRFDRNTGRITIVHTEINSEDVNKESICIVEDISERLWIGTNTGLRCYNLETKTYSRFGDIYRDTNNLNNDPIASLYADSKGILWIGGTQGLTLLNTKSGEVKIFKHSNTNSASISYDRPISFFDGGNDKMWIGTEGGGINEFDKKTGTFYAYTVKDGLPGNIVYGILNDDRGNLWLSTNKGLCRFTPPASRNEKIVCRNYNLSDGLPANEYFYNTSVKSNDGILYFGSVAGLVAFNPDEIKDNNFIPPVVITEFNVSNKPILPNDSSGILKLALSETKEIKLSYGQNNFSFTFAALNYVQPEKNKYAYKLDGYDNDWIYTDASKRFANYTNLAHGEYTFRVKASNNDGLIWNESGTSIKIIITPPWWKTIWFKLFCVLAVVSIAYIIYRIRMQKLRDMTQLRNKIANDLHDDLGATLSSISIMSELVSQQVKDKTQETRVLLDKIGNSSRNMIESMNDTVWAINPQNDTLENIIKRMRSFASEILSAKEIALHFDVDKNLLQHKLKMDDRRNFYFIFKEAINNVAKYSGAKIVFVTIRNTGNKLKMTIRDDGNGFDQSSVSNGNGLNTMHQRANEMKARLVIESIAGNGTIIELELKSELQ